MKSIIRVLRTEPALVAGAIGSVVALVVAFGVQLTAGETGAIGAVVSALLAVIVRSQVTPTAAGPAVIPPAPPPA